MKIYSDWQCLPEELCVKIFNEVEHNDRFNAAQVCTRWNRAFKSRVIWSDVCLTFRHGVCDERLKTIAQNFGGFIRKLKIKCYQQNSVNCENSCAFLEVLLRQTRLHIDTFELEFCEQNPLFYSGNLFVKTLKRFFLHQSLKQPIKRIDLSYFPVAFDDDVLNAITQKHSSGIEYLNIQNKVLTSRISPPCIANFVSKANVLQALLIPYSCFDSEKFKECVTLKSKKLQFLSLTFKRADKFIKCLDAEDWNLIRESLPDLRIELSFDPTYPLKSTFNIMLPEVPVSSLKLHFQGTVNEHLQLASTIYKQTLRMLAVTSTPYAQLDDAILTIVKECERLEKIHVMGEMSRETVEEILKIKQLKHFALSSDDDELLINECIV